MEAINGFTKGMDKDTAELFTSNQRYRHLECGDILYTDDDNSGDIVDIKGNKILDIVWASDTSSYSSIAGYPDVTILDAINPYSLEHIIVGVGYIRDDIVLFYTNSNGNDIIDLLKYNNGSYIRINIIYNIALEFKLNRREVVETRYEDESNKKVYFSQKAKYSTALHNLKYINVAPIILNGTLQNDILQGSYTRYNPFPNSGIDILGITGSVDLLKPAFVEFSGGSLRNGIYQYCYRYTNKNGNKTAFSDFSRFISLSKSNYTSTNEAKGGLTTGNYNELNSNKAIVLNIPVNANYSHLEVIRLWYSSYNAVPEVAIIRREEMPNSTLSIIDSKYDSTIGYLEASLFNVRQSLFNAKTLSSKDNILFPMNIVEDYFDIDFDARVYRWNSIADGNTTRLEKADGTFENSYNGSVSDITLSSIPYNDDVVNPSNKLSNDFTSYQNFKYKKDGATLGAYGVNIEVDFISYSVDLDTYTNNDFYSNLLLNSSLKKDLMLGRKKLFNLDEIYRFGIIFIDKYGRETTVKYIADLRIPSYIDIYGEDTTTNLVTSSEFIVPKFTIKAVGTEAEGLRYKIVYVERTSLDRTLLSDGLLSSLGERDNDFPDFECRPKPYTYASATGTGGDIGWSKAGYVTPDTSKPITYVYGFNSPEVMYNKNTDYNDCMIYIVGKYNGNDSKVSLFSAYYSGGTTNDDISGVTFDDGQEVPISSLFRPLNITFGKRASTYKMDIAESVNAIAGTGCVINNLKIEKYACMFIENTQLLSTKDDIVIGEIGTTNYLYLPNALTMGNYFSNGDIPRVQIRRDIVQYGGRSYEDRLLNVYIEASELTNQSTIEAWRGDTFLNMFEYQRVQYPTDVKYTENDPASKPYKHKIAETVIIPIFSSINTVLRSANSNMSLLSVSSDAQAKAKAMQVREEGLGYFQTVFYSEVPAPGGGRVLYGTSTKQRPLYEYNSVYSKKSNYKKYIPKRKDDLEISKLSTRIKYSDKKENGEFYDSWLNYRAANFKDVDNAFGSITYSKNFNNNLFLWQENAFVYVLVNPKVQVPADDGSSMIIGTGKVLYNFKYISSEIGIQNINEAIKSMAALYWLDNNKKKLYRYNGNIEALSDTKLLSSYIYKSIDKDTEFRGIYDNSRKKVIMSFEKFSGEDIVRNDLFTVTTSTLTTLVLSGDTRYIQMREGLSYKLIDSAGNSGEYILDTITDTSLLFSYVYNSHFSTATTILMGMYLKYYSSFTLDFDEGLDFFTGLEPFLPIFFIKGNKQFFTTEDRKVLYEHNTGNRRQYYGIKYPMILDIIVNNKSQFNKQFGALTISNKAIYNERDLTGDLDYVGNENVTFDSVRIIGDRNETEYLDLYTKNNKIITELDINGNPTGNIDDSNYIGNQRVIQDTNGVRLIPYRNYLYNVRMALNKFHLVLPRIKTGKIDTSDPNLREITELVRGNSCLIRLVFNKTIDGFIKVNNIITHYQINEFK